MKSVRYEYDHENGENEPVTKCFVQETTNEYGSTAYILTERPDNEGKNVATIAPEIGDSLVAEKLEQDPSYKPEQLRLYAERPERGEDGESRFAELSARTTKFENVSEVDNEFQLKADDWQWKDGNRFDKSELEQSLGAEITMPERRFQDLSIEEQNQEFRQASITTGRDAVFTEQNSDVSQAAQQEAANVAREQEQTYDR